MDWKDKMKVGMKIIKKACLETEVCCGCPFEKYCFEISGEYRSPNEWNIDDEDN